MRVQKRKANSRPPKWVAIDLFCGAGGMSLGLIHAGYSVIAGVDNEPACRATYEQITNADGSSPEFICKDIFPKTADHPSGQQDELTGQLTAVMAKAMQNEPQTRLLLAICAPCQPFTTITRVPISEQRKFRRKNDKNLLLTTLSLIEALNPDAIVVENVEGIGSGSQSILSVFQEQLAQLDFEFDYRVINASRFSVPQNRRRTIGLALDRKRYSTELTIPEFSNGPAAPKAGEILARFPPLAAGEAHSSVPNHRTRGLSDLNLKRISCAPPGESNHYLLNTPYGDLSLECHKRLKSKTGKATFSDTYTRMHPEEFAPTITTKFISITNGRFGHCDTRQHRALSVREAAALQTFPDDFIFHPESNLEFTAKLIGNAVPPALAKYLGEFAIAATGKKIAL